jgi:ABC-2 type transport system permease protein
VYLAQADLVAAEAPGRGAAVRFTDANSSTDASIVAPASFNNPVVTRDGVAANNAVTMPEIVSVDLMGGQKTNPVIAMYAAGIAVMFLLFSATTASGSLLEELENSTLDRLLSSRLTMDQLLLGKWSYLTMIGITQMILMFSWGALVFKIDLARHWIGFTAMAVVTAGASSSFALLLASLCKSRTQLGWVSTIVILSMSALGGSMVPRYLMSEAIQKAGLWTFNAWALEGFNKVFWRELSIDNIGMELAVLTASGAVFIVLARVFAIRWERA